MPLIRKCFRLRISFVRYLFFLFLIFISSSFSFGVPKEYLINHSDSSLQFLVSNLLLNTTRESVPSHSGTIRWDDTNLSDCKFSGMIASRNRTTKSIKRNRHVLMDDILAQKRFPEMTFYSTSIIKKREGYEIKGVLTSHGRTREFVAPLKIGAVSEDPYTGKKQRKFSAELPIDPQELAMRGINILGSDKITAIITVTGVEITSVSP